MMVLLATLIVLPINCASLIAVPINISSLTVLLIVSHKPYRQCQPYRLNIPFMNCTKTISAKHIELTVPARVPVLTYSPS